MFQLNGLRLSLTTASVALLALTACDSGIIIVDTGANQTTVIADPTKIVCDPFQNNPNYPAAGLDHGVVGTLGYIPTGSPGATRYQDFEDRGIWVDANIYLSDLNVPTRRFDLGFFKQDGARLVDQPGDKLYENVT